MKNASKAKNVQKCFKSKKCVSGPSAKYLWQSVKTCCRCCQLQSSEHTKWILSRSLSSESFSLFLNWTVSSMLKLNSSDKVILFVMYTIEIPLKNWTDFRYVSAVQGCRLEIVKRRWGSGGQIGFSAPPPPSVNPLNPSKTSTTP